MDRDEALRLLKGGPEGVAEWNWRRSAGEEVPNLLGANLKGADLTGANLNNWTNLNWANLIQADLRGADLRGVTLQEADLKGADLRRVGCEGTIFADVDLSEVKGLDSVEHIG